ncbi:uncharacterized protein loaf isoform X1 [Cloeon dipterum]|uniref:uncharacterized protein loaf isoform X1 n=1 Tax=Cloeon dipterum TaxID=197152 RepID=UPI00322056D2
MWVGVPEGGGSGRAGGWLLLLLLLLLLASRADSEKNKFYHMQTLCKNHFLQQQYRKTDGAVLRSQNEPNLECVLTFQTHTILQRFMLRFDLLQLDCNDHLYIYDGAHAVGSYKSDLSCRNTKQSVGAVFTRTNFVTLKYVTDAWGTENNGFKLIITAIKDPKHACKDFTCKVQEFCISPDLLCDDVNHCGDNSDEAGSDKCPPGHEMGTILGLGMPIFLVLTVGLILIVCISCVGCIFCVCRRLRGSNRRPQAQQANSDYPLTQTHGSNGAGGAYSNTTLAAQYSGVSATLPRSQQQMGSNYYATAATMARPLHHHQEGPRVSFLPSGNLPLPVAHGYNNSSESWDNPTTCPDASERPDQTENCHPTKRMNGSSRRRRG